MRARTQGILIGLAVGCIATWAAMPTSLRAQAGAHWTVSDKCIDAIEKDKIDTTGLGQAVAGAFKAKLGDGKDILAHVNKYRADHKLGKDGKGKPIGGWAEMGIHTLAGLCGYRTEEK